MYVFPISGLVRTLDFYGQLRLILNKASVASSNKLPGLIAFSSSWPFRKKIKSGANAIFEPHKQVNRQINRIPVRAATGKRSQQVQEEPQTAPEGLGTVSWGEARHRLSGALGLLKPDYYPHELRC